MEGASFAAGDLWGAYQRALLQLYEEGRGVPDEDLLGVFYERAQEMSGALREQLWAARGDLAQLEWAVLVVAGLEIAVASHVFVTELEQRRDASLRWEADLEEAPPPAREEVDSLLTEARMAFGEDFGMAGAAVDPSPAMDQVDRGIADLLGSCIVPAGAFARGVLLTEVGTLLESLNLFEGIGEVSFGSRRLRLGSGLIVKAVEKICALVLGRLTGDLVSRLDVPGLRAVLGTPLRDLSGAFVARTVRVSHARGLAKGALRGEEPGQAQAEALDTSLTSLCRDYQRNMLTAARIAKRVKWTSPVILLLGGVGPGRILVAGVNGAGLAYTLHSCADRLDTTPGWVPGVPSLVAEALA
jgi:hypothetical protein